jgi:putative membrane protein
MNRFAMTAIAAAALTTAACGKKDDASQDVAANPQIAAGASEAAGPAATPASPGQAFADTAAASDAFEIETSKLAATKAGSAKVKSFAAQMIKAHTDSTAKLKTAAAAASPAITPVAALTSAQQAKLDELSAKSGADFDQAYAAAQVDAHQMTLDALKAYSANGDVASLKAFATELVPIVTGHLNMAKGL